MISFLVASALILNVAQVDPGTAIDAYNRSSDKLEQVKERQAVRVASREALMQDKMTDRTTKFQERFSNMNQKWLKHWTAVLERLSLILDKIENRLAEQDGDTSAAEAAISDARKAILTAQASVDDLAEADYDIEFTTDEKFGPQLKEAIADFRSDSKETWELVKTAKEQVHAAFQEVRKLFSDNDNEEADEE